MLLAQTRPNSFWNEKITNYKMCNTGTSVNYFPQLTASLFPGLGSYLFLEFTSGKLKIIKDKV